VADLDDVAALVAELPGVMVGEGCRHRAWQVPGKGFA
jgi:hypothetical protein